MSTAATSPAAEARVAMLQELAEIGMNIARTLGNKAMEPDASADIPLQFARVAKAVRQTLALQARVEEGRLEAIRKAQAAPSAWPPMFHPRDIRIDPKLSEREQDGAERLYEVIDILDEYEAPEDCEDLSEDLLDWVRQRNDYADFAQAPYAAIVARICADLDLPAEWGETQLEDYLTEALPYQQQARQLRAAGPTLVRHSFSEGGLAAHEAAALNTS